MAVPHSAFRNLVLRLFLSLIAVAGLWPHFSTQASWLAAAALAGVIFLLGGVFLKNRLMWGSISVGLGVVVWLIRAKTRLVVRPEQLLPDVQQVGISLGGLMLAAIAAIVVVYALARVRTDWRVYGLLILAIAIQIVSSLQLGSTVRQLSRHEPGDYSYNFDGIRYLKSFYLLKSGLDWYEACVESTRVDSRGPFDVPRVVMNYRLPTLYVLLSFLPNGEWIPVVFVALSCFGMWAVFDVVRHIVTTGGANPNHAGLCGVCGALVLSPYLLVGAVTWFYTFHEYWAWFVAVGSVCLLARRQYAMAIALGFLSACIREHFLLVPIALSIPIWRSQESRGRFAVCAGWVLLVAVYIVHVQRAIPFTGQDIGAGTSVWFHQPSLKSIEYSAFFGTGLYPWPRAIIPVLCAAALLGFRRHKRQWVSICLMGLIAVTVLGYLIVGPAIKSGGYWGIVYMPWILLGVPLLGGILDEENQRL
ncbi:MAG: hypothetical protein ABIH23_13250 [bacterium]